MKRHKPLEATPARHRAREAARLPDTPTPPETRPPGWLGYNCPECGKPVTDKDPYSLYLSCPDHGPVVPRKDAPPAWGKPAMGFHLQPDADLRYAQLAEDYDKTKAERDSFAKAMTHHGDFCRKNERYLRAKADRLAAQLQGVLDLLGMASKMELHPVLFTVEEYAHGAIAQALQWADDEYGTPGTSPRVRLVIEEVRR